LLARHWWALTLAFMLLRMLPRVIIGEDMDAGLVGNGYSFVAQLLQPLGDVWGTFAATQLMDAFDYLFSAVATVILLRDGVRLKWYGLLPGLALTLLFFALLLISEAIPLLYQMTTLAHVSLYLLLLVFALATALSGVAATDELRAPAAAVVRSVKLAGKGPFRLLLLLLVVMLLVFLSQQAERLLLTAIPVTDGNWFDWLTTVFQEIISGFYLPFEVAIMVAAFLHLRRRYDGDKPEDTAAIFD
jgi:hypothetical protein